MADDPPGKNLLDTILATEMDRMAQAHRRAGELTEFLARADTEYDVTVLENLLLASINGRTDLKAQRVEVSYLGNDQKLFIPIGLGINPLAAGASRAPRISWLLNRYWRVTTLTFTEVHTWFINRTPFAEIRAHVDGLVFPEQRVVRQDWTIDAPADMQIHEIDNVFLRLSIALQLNYDIRDTGILNNVDMSVADNAWVDISTISVDRVRQKLKAFSLQAIAALNYEACAKHAPSAWARAYGVGCGILPVTDSKTHEEFVWTKETVCPQYMTALSTWEKTLPESPIHLCINMLAMFGFFHLNNKDYTYKSELINMDRICITWINTLCTMTTATGLMDLVNNKESVCRTAAHPFGLAQTYWFAKVLCHYGKLAKALAIRIDVTPPPVQKIMICDAARKLWSCIPAGKVVNGICAEAIKNIAEEVTTIRKSPPSYSVLYYLYGIAKQARVSAVAKDAVEVMMPIVCGYAEVMHTDQQGNKEGIALALSRLNVGCHNVAAIAHTWAVIWEVYLNEMDTAEGILKFTKSAEDAYNSTQVGRLSTGARKI